MTSRTCYDELAAGLGTHAGRSLTAAPARRGPQILDTVRQFFIARYAARVPLAVLFWRDMMIVGSAINIATLAAALAYLANDGNPWVGTAILFGCLPYNFFLVISVWRTVDAIRLRTAGLVRFAALAWLLVFFVL